MNVGLIARCDQGGLAQMTVEFARHMQPHKVLVVDLQDAGRSPADLERLDFVDPFRMMVTGMPIGDAEWRWLLEDIDVLYTAEIGYRQGWAEEAAAAGVRTVLHAMPELYDDDQADGIYLPTTWERQRIPQAELLGVPVATDRLVFRHRKKARRFMCAPGPAFHDRDGLLLVMQAMFHLREDVTILLRTVNRNETAARLLNTPVPSNVCIELHDPWSIYTETPDFDCLLLPRRYGGLSLPMQEAAALGCPTIALNREPSRPFLSRQFLAHCHIDHSALMKGGRFDVYDTDPKPYAALIDRAVQRPDLFAEASARCGDWAAASSWEVRAPEYHRALQAIAEGAQ